MRMFRVTSPVGVDYLKPHLIVDDEWDRDSQANFMKDSLVSNPSGIFILEAFEKTPEGEDLELIAFLVATNDPRQAFTFLIQAWERKALPLAVARSMFLKLVFWTEGLGKSEIRTETIRSAPAIERKWGFEPLSTIMRLRITTQMEEALVSAISGGGKEESFPPKPSGNTFDAEPPNEGVNENGRIEQTQNGNGLLPDERPTGSDEPAGAGSPGPASTATRPIGSGS